MNIDSRPGHKNKILVRPRRTRRLELDRLEERCVPATFVVNSLADFLTPPPGTPPGTLTLREAIQSANQGVAQNGSNTIDLSVAGTYRITTLGSFADDNSGGEFDIEDASGYSLTIVNTSGGRAVVDGGGLTRVFDINQVANESHEATVSFVDLTITDGSANHSFGSSSSSEDGCGGGIQAQSGVNVNLDDVDLVDNFAPVDGGGIDLSYGTLTIQNGSIADNYAADGGGVYSPDVTTISDAFFQGNHASQDGGALDIGSSDQSTSSLSSSVTSATVTRSRFSGNVASAGGAISDEADTLSLQYCTLDQNHAGIITSSGSISDGDGGALCVFGPGSSSYNTTASVANCLFVNNAASDGQTGSGGAIEQKVAALTVLDSQFSENVAYSQGGAIDFGGSTLIMSGTTIVNSLSDGIGGGAQFRRQRLHFVRLIPDQRYADP